LVKDGGPTLVDTHAHLDFSDYDKDRDEVLKRAAREAVSQVVTVGFDLESSEQALALASENTEILACVGVHPHEAGKVDGACLQHLEELGGHPRAVGIGEIGLDYYRDRSPREAQQRVFRQQLELAARVRKPVVIHDRDAHVDVMSTIRQWAEGLAGANGELKPPLGVVHCYSGDQAMAEELFELGFLVSVAGPVTYAKADRLQALVSVLPLDKLLLETDCPFLSPHPYRGRRNEPANVRIVASKVAELKNLPWQEVARTTTENARRLFRLE
jgi:TatD DNase family protein